MFEKEAMISGLKKNSRALAELIEELESKVRFHDHDMLYSRETLKKIESELRRIRKMDEEMEPVTRGW